VKATSAIAFELRDEVKLEIIVHSGTKALDVGEKYPGCGIDRTFPRLRPIILVVSSCFIFKRLPWLQRRSISPFHPVCVTINRL
jgi:hypothetical protein